MEHRTPNEILPEFYETYNLPPDGGQSESHVTVELTDKIHVYIPNFDARRKAVLRHDVHHIITGYPSIMKGEAEISAWEIASGCLNYWAAFLLDSQGLLIGVFLYPRVTFNAFKRGRRTRNLYQDKMSEEAFLNTSVRELKSHLGLDNATPAQTTIGDVLSYIFWILICGITGLISLLFLPFLILYNLKMFIKPK